ncbi:MAG: S-adenosylmethionine decarboxylase [Candidatus Micrarchaeota archaeon]|nr:S-adenosylmethionine decarboxylase [Candidatus Micrarchaeota archaeon]
MHGPHLMVDAYECEPGAVRSLDNVYRFLDELPAKIGMTKITKPYLFFHKDRPEEEPGITGFVVIAESHISIHTFPARGNYLTMDIYSCKDFDKGYVLSYIRKLFKPAKMEHHHLVRGKHFAKQEVMVPIAAKA